MGARQHHLGNMRHPPAQKVTEHRRRATGLFDVSGKRIVISSPKAEVDVARGTCLRHPAA